MLKKNPSQKFTEIMLFVFMPILIIFCAIAIPFISVGNVELDFNSKADVTMTNGILTANAIIFGFVTYDLRKIGKTLYQRALLATPLLLFLIASVDLYFIDAVTKNAPTINTLIWITVSFFFDVLWYLYVMVYLKPHLDK